MEPKTSKSYLEAVLEKYKKEKGGEMTQYLAEPTTARIRKACIVLLEERKSQNDQWILNYFFTFKDEKNKLKEIQHFDVNKFKPIVNFLKGKTTTTNPENIELISWLIDFRPRPRQEYLKARASSSQEPEEAYPRETNKPGTGETTDSPKTYIKKKAVIVGVILVLVAITSLWITKTIHSIEKETPKTNIANIEGEFVEKNAIIGNTNCMTWVDTVYVQVSCNTRPNHKKKNRVEPLDPVKLENFKKTKVYVGFDFFDEEGNPLIWYYKSKEGELEYYTAPGLHPIHGETLRKITPYIIDKYVPLYP